MAGQRRTQPGLTIIEMLIVLAILGILLAIAIPNLRPPAAQLAANSVQAFVQQARFEAIRLNGEVGVTFENGRFTSRAGGCSGSVVRALDLLEYPQVAASGGSFQWLHNGEARSCTGGAIGVNGVSWRVSDSRRETTVRVGPGGVVTVE